MHKTRHFRAHRANKRQSVLTLNNISPGETVELMRIGECRRLRRRLADLGLCTGLSVRVIRNGHGGPLILAVREDTRLAIGRGMARKIRVRFQDSPED